MSERAVRLGWWLSSEEHDPRELVKQATLAERAGFATAMISDHLQPWVRHQGNAAHVWTVIGAIAHATEQLEIGTGVTAMVHRNDPINVAQAACTAAVMLEDRFFLGVGAGERLNEQPFGQRWPRPGERRAQLEEAVDVIRQLCSGETVNHRGASWAVENLRMMTLPASPPSIYVAAGGVLSAASAGKIGDGIIGVAPDAHLIDVFHGSGGAGKPCLGQLHVSLGATMDAAVDNAWEWWPHGVLPPSVFGELAQPKNFESLAEAVGRSSIADVVVCGTGSEPVVEAIDRFVAAGYDTVYLHQIGPDQQRLADVAAAELFSHYRKSS
jgi:coenzyme F420-dependent glucose-6-phosphate dehydrogenase